MRPRRIRCSGGTTGSGSRTWSAKWWRRTAGRLASIGPRRPGRALAGQLARLEGRDAAQVVEAWRLATRPTPPPLEHTVHDRRHGAAPERAAVERRVAA